MGVLKNRRATVANTTVRSSQSCPSGEPVDGGAICCVDKDTCTDKIESMTLGLPKAIMEGIIAGKDPAGIAKAVYDAINSVLGFVMFKCDA